MGIAERINRTIALRIRTIRLDLGFPDYLWRELAKTAVYLINRSPTRSLEGKTPYEAWYGSKPDLSHLKIIGSAVYCVNVEDEKLKKLDPVARKCRLIGYGPGNNQYRVWNPDTAKVEDVTFVKIDESDCRMTDSEIELIEDIGTDEIDPYEPSSSDDESDSSGSEDEDQVTYESEQGPVRRPKQTVEVVVPKRRRHPVTHMLLTVNRKSTVHEPTYLKALNSDEADEWKKAMKDEYNSLIENHTWDLVMLPEGQKALSATWVLCHKFGPYGEVIRNKARWVARGFLQRYGKDFGQTWASVVKAMTYRLLFAFAVANGWYIRQGDIKTAFLNGDIEEEIYVIQPTGFEIMDENGKPFVCKLKKALYGLKQAARA